MKSIYFCLLLALICGYAAADSGGSDWSTSYGFPGSAKHQTNMNQADLIAKKEAGYYDNIGKTQVYNITTTSIGTMTTTTTSINGNDNNVASDSISTGGMDASVKLLSSSAITTQK